MANSNVLVMREEEMDLAVNGLEKCSTNMENTGKSIPNKFRGMKNTGLFGTGINTINKQVNSITNSLFNVKTIVRKHSNEMFELDRKMAEKASEIEIPQDFVKNDSRQTNTFNDILMEKIDGRSVNEGGELRDTKEMDESIIANKQELTDITSSGQTKEEKLDDSTIIIGKENMQNINNDGGTVEQKLNDASNIAFQAINNINNAQNLSEQTLDNTTSINNRVVLNNINNHGAIVQENPGLGVLAGASGADIASGENEIKKSGPVIADLNNFNSIQNTVVNAVNTVPKAVVSTSPVIQEAVKEIDNSKTDENEV